MRELDLYDNLEEVEAPPGPAAWSSGPTTVLVSTASTTYAVPRSLSETATYAVPGLVNTGRGAPSPQPPESVVLRAASITTAAAATGPTDAAAPRQAARRPSALAARRGVPVPLLAMGGAPSVILPAPGGGYGLDHSLVPASPFVEGDSTPGIGRTLMMSFDDRGPASPTSPGELNRQMSEV